MAVCISLGATWSAHALGFSPALGAFLAGLIDYAGLFPPAKLPMDETCRNYAVSLASEDAFALLRIVEELRVARVADLHHAQHQCRHHGHSDLRVPPEPGLQPPHDRDKVGCIAQVPSEKLPGRSLRDAQQRTGMHSDE